MRKVRYCCIVTGESIIHVSIRASEIMKHGCWVLQGEIKREDTPGTGVCDEPYWCMLVSFKRKKQDWRAFFKDLKRNFLKFFPKVYAKKYIFNPTQIKDCENNSQIENL